MVKEMDEIDGDPIFNKDISGVKPEIEATKINRLSLVRPTVAERFARMLALDPCRTRSTQKTPFDKKRGNVLNLAVGESVQPEALVAGFELVEAEAGADATRAIPFDIGVEIAGDAHAREIAFVKGVETAEEEISAQFQRFGRLVRVGLTDFNTVKRRRRGPDAGHAETRWQDRPSNLFEPIHHVDENLDLDDLAIFDPEKLTPTEPEGGPNRRDPEDLPAIRI